jgi:hypothetical protein
MQEKSEKIEKTIFCFNAVTSPVFSFFYFVLIPRTLLNDNVC